jgi:hypothetical protein
MAASTRLRRVGILGRLHAYGTVGPQDVERRGDGLVLRAAGGGVRDDKS